MNDERQLFRRNLETTTRGPSVWEQPTIFDPNSIADQREINRQFRDGAIVATVDRFSTIAHDFFEYHNPSLVNDTRARMDFVNDVIGTKDKHSMLIQLPWRRELWRFPIQEYHLRIRTSRYNPIVRPDEQKSIYHGQTSLVAGLSVGKAIEETLVMAGICDSHIIADYDTLTLTNTGRSTGKMDQIGQKKIDNAACDTSETDPYIRQLLLREGINAANLAKLGDVGLKPNIIFDAVDSMRAKAELRDYARKENIPLVMITDLGDRSVVDIEDYKNGSPQPFNGRIKERQFEAMLAGHVTTSVDDSRQYRDILKAILGMRNLTPRLLKSFGMLGSEISGYPQEGAIARIGGGAASLVAREILLGHKIKSGRYVINLSDTLNMQHPDPLMHEVKMVTGAIQKAYFPRRPHKKH